MSDSISTRPMTRREAIAAAAAFGAALAWPARFQYPQHSHGASGGMRIRRASRRETRSPTA